MWTDGIAENDEITLYNTHTLTPGELLSLRLDC